MNRTNAATIALVLGVSLVGGCAADGASGDPASTGACTDSASAGSLGVPTRNSAMSGAGTRHWYAMKTLSLGTTDRHTGTSSPDAWKDFGYDLDGRATTACDSEVSKGTCKRLVGSPGSILADGNHGIDNSFSAHFMSTLKALSSDIDAHASDPMTAGARTLILRLDDLGDLGVRGMGDDASVPGALFIGRDLGGAPTFTEADHWRVAESSLVDGATLEKPVVTFPDAYVTGGVWVAEASGTTSIELAFPFRASVFGPSPRPVTSPLLALPLENGILTFQIPKKVPTAGDGEGTLAGAISLADLRGITSKTLPAVGICSGNATFDQVVLTMTQSADLVLGPPRLQDETRECDALSVGVGFTVSPTGEPTRVAGGDDPPVVEDTCAKAADGGDAGGE